MDICGRRLHRLALGSGFHEVWPTPDFPTSIALRTGAVVGLRKRDVLWDFGETFRPVAAVEPDLPANRLNEGCGAPDGSFFADRNRRLPARVRPASAGDLTQRARYL